jgi:anti-sigma regulatory factor (Ser/Thr protein kinase)
MPGMEYEEKELFLAPGDSVLFYSDGLVEAHNPAREMFGFPHLMKLLEEKEDGAPTIDFLLGELTAFTGADWEQEDDVTLVTLRREAAAERDEAQPDEASRDAAGEKDAAGSDGNQNHQSWRVLDEMVLPSVPGNERQAMSQVAEAVAGLNLSHKRLEELKTAVAEATMNAMEHGNHYQPEIPVIIQVLTSASALAVRITDQGQGPAVFEPKTPDLEAKLEEIQSPRGWGLFLIKNLVDEMHVTHDGQHTIELIINLDKGGGSHVNQKS